MVLHSNSLEKKKKKTLQGFRLQIQKVPMHCETSAISLNKNLVHHSKAKHMQKSTILLIQKGDITMEFVCTLDQLANIFTKFLNEDRFCNIRRQPIGHFNK